MVVDVVISDMPRHKRYLLQTDSPQHQKKKSKLTEAKDSAKSSNQKNIVRPIPQVCNSLMDMAQNMKMDSLYYTSVKVATTCVQIEVLAVLLQDLDELINSVTDECLSCGVT